MSDADELKRLIAKSKRIVAFTGAGISTESGIPDYRSPGGIWTRMRPIEFSDFLADPEMRRETWRRKFASDEMMRKATPNAGHRALAKLVEQGKMTAVITQNIDGLHQASGIPEDKIIELHGNATYATCLECGKRYELEWVRKIFEPDERLPLCTSCTGMIKTATISFGQSMPDGPMRRAREAALDADLMLAIGSSLVVYPAATFPILAKRSGATYAIINREPTDQDQIADLVINAEIGATLSKAVGVN
ncbi:MAG: Sir2 family NAD-dependent protein deacetylase [Proteobacteria bacterium]|nr:Sir2 family NAD-dependent protein deacetylase [Pseudomonadota bacterium]